MSPLPPGTTAELSSFARVESDATLRGPGTRVVVGEVFDGRYRVAEKVSSRWARWYRVVRLADDRECLLRASAEAPESRRAHVVRKLSEARVPGVQRLIEAFDGGERIEIWAAEEGTSLRSWCAMRAAFSLVEITELIRQLRTTLLAMHGVGLGHFRVTTDTVLAAQGDKGWEFQLGGFDALEEWDQAELVSIAVDPFSAPPEAAGLFKHRPSRLLAAWDWWSLGRLVQEVLLGQPVALQLPSEIRMKLSREPSALAEAMLFEREIGALRAGGVELMGKLEPGVELLLRGLLTSAQEGRWGAAELAEWLEGGTPRERYAHPRQTRFFRWNDRGYSVPEAAAMLGATESIGSQVRHLFASEEKDTLVHFLRDDPAQRTAAAALKPVHALRETPALQQAPEELARAVVAAVGLHALSGGEFFWHGERVAESLSRRLAASETAQEAIAELRVLASPPVDTQIRRLDHRAADFLAEGLRDALAAEQLVLQAKLDRGAAAVPLTRLWAHAVRPAAELELVHAELRRRFAGCDVKALEQIWKTPHPPAKHLVVLAWTAEAPEEFGFVTEETLTQRRHDQLTAQARAAGQVLFWRNLARALAGSPLLFGPAWLVVGGVLLLNGLVAVHLPGPWGCLAGLLPGVVFLAVRWLANRWHARLVARWFPGADNWRWRDEAGRSGREAERLADASGLPRDEQAVRLAYARALTERAAVQVAGPVEKLPPVPMHGVTWAAVAVSWLMLAGSAAASAGWAWRHPPDLAAHATAWAKAVGKEKPVVRDEDIKLAWPFKRPLETPFEISVKGMFTPTREQAATALARGRALVSRYRTETIEGLLAVYVPGEGGEGALLFFDGKRGTLMSRHGVRIDFVPFPRSWMQVGEECVFFLEK